MSIACWRALAPIAFLALLLSSGKGIAQQENTDFGAYHRAADYCRGDIARPVALNPGGDILCFDGSFDKSVDISPVTKLREGGLVVVRSPGGDIASAIALSRLVRDRRAIVVVYDYCLSACATYLLIAPDRAGVLRNSLVAWDYESSDPAFPACARVELQKTRDGGFRVQRGSCLPAFSDQTGYRAVLSVQTQFFRERMVDPWFEPPPDNLHIRKVLGGLYPDSQSYHYVVWTLHPRYFARLFKAKISYEAYPTEEEADALAARLPRKVRLIYDP